MWPCCDFTSSDDDEHNTDNNFLLLFADVDITPTLLEGLPEGDVLHIALGCRFALDIFTISQQYSLHLITSQYLSTLSSYSYSEVWCHTRLMVAMTVRSLGQRSCKRDSHSKTALCVVRPRGYTVSAADTQRPTT